MKTIPILTYHSLDTSGSVISVAPATFEWQMESLRHRGYRSLTLSDAVGHLVRREPFPERAFVATFDDGYQNNFEHALPVLRKCGFTATIFLIPDYCAKRNDWPGQPAAIPRLPLMSWAEIAQMRAAGVEFGAHTCTHPDLRRLPLLQAEHEIVNSRAKLEASPAGPAKVFAYPYGSHDPAIREVVRRHFTAAVTTRLARAGHADDLWQLPRLDMYYLRNRGLFQALGTHLLDSYLGFRQWLRNVKAAYRR